MHKSLIPVLVLCLAACAGHYAQLPFNTVFKGELSDITNVSVSGKMDTSGINFYSLTEPTESQGSLNCIALILNANDQARADSLDGREVLVTGRVIFLADLIQMIPSQRGNINGRTWSGTDCAGEVAIYVTHLMPVPALEGPTA